MLIIISAIEKWIVTIYLKDSSLRGQIRIDKVTFALRLSINNEEQTMDSVIVTGYNGKGKKEVFHVSG